MTKKKDRKRRRRISTEPRPEEGVEFPPYLMALLDIGLKSMSGRGDVSISIRALCLNTPVLRFHHISLLHCHFHGSRPRRKKLQLAYFVSSRFTGRLRIWYTGCSPSYGEISRWVFVKARFAIGGQQMVMPVPFTASGLLSKC